ncbi:MAG: hypothetical protein KY455_07850 [Euryarchaeota archaeon]|nr:hypothetical protein [Euryarchaeota archaeon]
MALPGGSKRTAARREAEARAKARRRPEEGPGQDDRSTPERGEKAAARAAKKTARKETRAKARRERQELRATRRLERKLKGPTFWSLFEPIPKHPRRVPKGQAILIFVLNAFPFPGLGTVLYGKWERGLAQFLLTFVFLIGWVWSVTDGIVIVKNAFQAPRDEASQTARTP